MSQLKQNGREQGFTLVELAIVLVIVGLLIGGILKGQELIASTRATSTASMIGAIEAASTNFQDTYGAIPGDLASASTRIPNCATANSICNIDGNGNNRIDQVPGAAMAIGAGAENVGFFGHLAGAELIGGVSPAALVLSVADRGLMGAPLGNGAFFRVGYHTSGTIVGATATSAAGHYLFLGSLAVGTAATATNVEDAGIQTKAANKIDVKYDDGLPLLGSIIAANTTAAGAAAGCVSGTTYNTRNPELDCGLFIQIIK